MYRRENLRLAARALRLRGVRGIGELGLSWLASRLEPDRVPVLPPFLHLEVTTRCNLRCFTCARAVKQGVDELSLSQVTQIFDQAPSAAKVCLYGIGEPLLNHEFFPMLREAHRRGLYTVFFTNLTLLNDRNVETLLASAPDLVNLSVDAASKAMFEHFRTGAVFEKCMEGLRRLARAVQRLPSGSTSLAIWYDGLAQNIGELPAVVRLAGDLGIPTVMIQDLLAWNLPEIAANLSGSSYHDGNQAIFTKALKAAACVGRAAGVEVWRYASAADGVRTCHLPWFYVFITARGQVTPCNWNGYDGSLSFGNIFERPLAEIWNSLGYQQFRQELKAPTRPALCVGCPFYDRRLVRIA